MKRILLLFGLVACWTAAQAQLTAPFTESFDVAGLPTGWTNTSTNTSTNANWKVGGTPGNPSMATSPLYQPPVNLDLTGNSGNFAWVDGSTPNVDDSGLLTDSIDVSALTNAYVQFWIYSNNVTNPGDNMTLYLNFYDGTAWQDSIWGFAGDITAWQFVGIDLSAYTISGNVLFEWVVDQTTAGTAYFNDILLDDISVIERPACPFPLNFASSNITATTADLSWTGVAGGTNYEVIYGTSGFNPASAGMSVTSSTTMASLSSLTGATTYQAYLVATCGANGDSDTAGPISFQTSCVPFTLPYSNNFDSETDGQVPFCWEQYRSYGTNAYARVENLGTPRSGTLQYALYTGSGFSATDTLIGITPEFSDLTVGDKQIRFHAKISDIQTDKLYIYTLNSNNTSATGTLIDSVVFTAVNVYQEVILPITTANGYNGTDTYIAFAADLSSAATFDYIYIDDFFSEVIPSCPKVSNLSVAAVTGTSADIAYSTPGTAAQYEWGLAGFTQGTNLAGIVSTTSNPFTISGLSGNTAYDVYVRNDCGGGDSSVWEGPFTFTTAIVPPYLEDFASGIPSTYGVDRGLIGNPTTFSGFGAWGQDGFGNVGFTGAARLNIYSTFVQDWLFGPAVDLGTGTIDYQLEFDAALTQFANTSQGVFGADDTVHVVLSYDGGATWNRSDAIFTLTSSDVISNTGTHFIVSLAGITGGVNFAFYGASVQSNTDNDFFIDNVEIKEIPTCPQPLGANGIVASPDSVWLNWTSGSNLTLKGFVEYGPTGFPPGGGLGTIATLDTFAGIGGLTGNTTYDIYVYDSCASGFSPLTGPITLTTLCNPLIAPSTETFNNGALPACWTEASTSGSGWLFTGNAGWGAAANGRGAGTFAWVDGSGAGGNDNRLVSPLYDVSGLTVPQLYFEFYSNNTNSTGSNNTFRVNFWDGAQWNDSIWVYRGDDPAWQLAEVLLAGYTITGPVQFEFIVDETAGTTFHNDILLDSVSVDEAPPCPTPNGLTVTNIGSTSADINVTAVNATSYNIEWGPTGFIQGSGTGTLVTGINTLPYSITTLTPNTFYDVYIQVDCGVDGTSVWIGPITFKSNCTAALAGTYTIGGTAGPTNFATLDSAIAVLNGCGISAPVTFNFSGGASYPPVTMLDIQGGSSTNTVTFNGSVSNPDTIQGFDIIGSDWVTFNDVYFERSSGFVVRLSGQANNNTFNRCTVVNEQTSTSSLNSCIAVTGTPTSFFSGGNNANNLTVDNCTFIGGYAGVSTYGTAADRHSGFTITNNVFDNQYNNAIYLFQTDSVEVRNNVMLNGLRSTFSYGIFASSVSGSEFTENEIYGGTYGMGLININIGTPSARRTLVANNMFKGNTYGIWFQSGERVDMYHNTAFGGVGVYLGNFAGVPSDMDIRNNVFGAEGTLQAIFVNGLWPANSTLNYNAYDTASGAAVASYDGTIYNDLAAWGVALTTQNANSVEGSAGIVSSTDFHLLGGLANDVGDNTVGITVDIDGDTRPATGSTTVDMGADEYTPVTEDIAIISVDFDRNSPCYTTNDTIVVTIENTLGATKDFSVDNLVIDYSVTGPINTASSYTLNTGTLALNNTLGVRISGIDMSLPGTYSVVANLAPSSTNLTAVNDTIGVASTDDVRVLFDATPDTVVFVSSATDTVEIKAASPLLGSGGFYISEICQFAGAGTGAPAAGRPTYLTTDDYIEITGVPGSDLGGFTLEQYNGTGLAGTFTFNPGTVMSPNGTAIIAVGQLGASVEDPSNFYYHGNGTYAGLWSSTTPSGRVLKDPSGNIVDAIAYAGSSSFTFPAAAGVTSADWDNSTPTPAGTSSWGIRLEGPDNNDGSGWIACTVAGGGQQDPNALNNNAILPSPPSVAGFDWILNGASWATSPDTFVTGFNSSGIFYYVATYNGVCGLLQDTVTIVVNLGCATPANFSATVNACDDVDLDWTGAGDSTIIAVVPAGATPTTGALVAGDSTYNYTAGMSNTSYDVYITNICGGDTSTTVGPFSFAIANEGAPTASFTSTIGGLSGTFDASASTGSGLTYDWDFGDGNTGTGVNASHTYAAGGSYTITLIVSNACGSDTTTITEGSVSIFENPLSNSLVLFPNPTAGNVQVEFATQGENSATLRIIELSGKEVLNVNETLDGDSHVTNLDLSGLARGVYTLEINSGDMIATRRLIKN